MKEEIFAQPVVRVVGVGDDLERAAEATEMHLSDAWAENLSSNREW
jgi:hypothetical protein